MPLTTTSTFALSAPLRSPTEHSVHPDLQVSIPFANHRLDHGLLERTTWSDAYGVNGSFELAGH